MWLRDPSADSKFFPPDKNATLLIPSLVQDSTTISFNGSVGSLVSQNDTSFD